METVLENGSVPDAGYEFFKDRFLRLTGINLHAYKEKQMKRRISTLIERKGCGGFVNYISRLETDPAELAYFVDYITINVTEFFRTPDHWNFFEKNVLGELVRRKGENLRIWSCACASGEEPYSIVMSLAEYLPLSKIKVTATDIDRKILAQAEKGIFSDKSMEGVPEDRRQKFFSKTGTGWEISEEVRKCVDFRRLDLLQEDFPREQDLIVCRNVLIYFTEDSKNRIYRQFYDSLADGGYLFTGNTEQIIQYKLFGFLKQKNFLYKKDLSGEMR